MKGLSSTTAWIISTLLLVGIITSLLWQDITRESDPQSIIYQQVWFKSIEIENSSNVKVCVFFDNNETNTYCTSATVLCKELENNIKCER